MTGNGAGRPLGLFTASGRPGISTARDIATGNTATEIKFDPVYTKQNMPLNRNIRQQQNGYSTAMQSKRSQNLRTATVSTYGSLPLL